MSALPTQKEESAHAQPSIIWTASPTGPDTIAGKYMRKFWAAGVARGRFAAGLGCKPIRIMSEDFYRSIAVRAANLTWSIFAARTANQRLLSAGSKMIAFAAAFTAGNSTPRGSASSNRLKKKPSAKKSASVVARRKNISDSYSSISAKAKPRALPRYPDF